MKKMKRTTVKTRSILALCAILLGSTACNEAVQNDAASTQIEAPSTPIQEATFFGNLEVIEQHISAQSNLNVKDEFGSTPLHIASTFGKTEAAVLLIKGGADLNASSADGSTPLHTAAFYGRVEIVKALLENQAATDIRNSYGATALESVLAPFADMKPVYDQLSKDLGPFGLKLDYEVLQVNRASIAKLIQNAH